MTSMGHRVAHRCHNENKKQSESKINDIDGPSRGPSMSPFFIRTKFL